MSGVALGHLHLVLSWDEVPQALFRERLALRAAEVWVAHSGRPELAGELRDAVAFLQPGDNPGPAGEVWLTWRRAVGRPVSVKALHRALPKVEAEQIATWLGAGQGAPVTRAANVLEVVRRDRSRDDTGALILAEAALAQALGWSPVVPLSALGLKRTDLRNTGEELVLACHRAIETAAIEATREAADLARRAARRPGPRGGAGGVGRSIARRPRRRS